MSRPTDSAPDVHVLSEKEAHDDQGHRCATPVGRVETMFWKLQENVISEDDLETLVAFIRETQRFTQFTKVREFEAAFAEWQKCRYAVLVNSGSSANLLLVNAVKELRKWHEGDEVIVPAVTWPTTITPVMQSGLKPVFSDVNLFDLSFDYDRLESLITPRTRAIFVAHLLGFPADIRRLQDIARRRNLALLEDCCESMGATADGVNVGNVGAGGTFSFYWGHHMTTVEGGMLSTNDEALYKTLVTKRSHGLARELPPQYHDDLKVAHHDIDFSFLFLTDGFNFRNTEFNAVLGIAQLKRIDEFIRIRNRNYTRFVTMCANYSDHLITINRTGLSSFVFPFLFRDAGNKKAFQRFISASGIESRPLISGNLLRQPFLNSYYVATQFPNADFIHDNAFYIGNNQFVDDQRLDRLESLLHEFFAG